MTNYRNMRFAVLEFALRATTPAKLFAPDERTHYDVIGHRSATCGKITEKRQARDTCLSEYLADHEYFDGELVFSDPWPCAMCIPTESLPEVKLDPLPEPYKAPPSGWGPEDTAPAPKPEGEAMASDAQVRKLMALYRKSKPNATKEQAKAAEARAAAMTLKQAIATITKLEKGEKPTEAHKPSPVGATSGIAKGSKVRKGDTEGRVFWTGTGKSGALRYGVIYKDASGEERKEFTEHGWEVVK